MNTLYVLLDGAVDHPIPEFGNKQPLDVAEMPFIKGNIKSIGTTTGREYTHLFLNEFFTGKPPSLERAVLEAIGLGMDMNDRTAFRLSPAFIDGNMVKWAYDTESFYKELEEAVMDSLHILNEFNPEIKFFISGRAILTMNYEPIANLPAPPIDCKMPILSGKIWEFIQSVSEKTNGIADFPWGCGSFTKQHPPLDCVKNLTAFSDSPTSLGICASLGYNIKMIKSFEERFSPAREALEHGDVFLHLDEIDEYSHMKKPEKKVSILEKADKLMEKHFSDVDRIAYFIDHGTSSITGEHLPIETPFWCSYSLERKEMGLIPVGKLLNHLANSSK